MLTGICSEIISQTLTSLKPADGTTANKVAHSGLFEDTRMFEDVSIGRKVWIVQ